MEPSKTNLRECCLDKENLSAVIQVTEYRSVDSLPDGNGVFEPGEVQSSDCSGGDWTFCCSVCSQEHHISEYEKHAKNKDIASNEH